MKPKLTLSYEGYSVEVEPTDITFEVDLEQDVVDGVMVRMHSKITSGKISLEAKTNNMDTTRWLQALIVKYMFDLKENDNITEKLENEHCEEFTS